MRLIDADALKENLKLPEESGRMGELLGMVINAVIEGAPTIEGHKTGKWIPHKSIFGGLGEPVYTCDQCGYNIGFHSENFCPNCGADMREQP